MLNLPPDIEAEIAFLSTASGGRSVPVASGYRPNHDFGIPGMINDAQHDYLDVDWVQPGETVMARLAFFAPDFQIGRLYVGMEFTVQEGPKIVGRGKITQVLNPTLKKTS